MASSRTTVELSPYDRALLREIRDLLKTPHEADSGAKRLVEYKGVDEPKAAQIVDLLNRARDGDKVAQAELRSQIEREPLWTPSGRPNILDMDDGTDYVPVD